MLVFTTPTLIDIPAMLTFGVSAKLTTNPIGQFGTGAKYAIAGVLRLGGSIQIEQDGEHINFYTEPRASRGVEYSSIMVAHQKTEPAVADQNAFMHIAHYPCGFSTSLGQHWKPWMIYRELWTNTKDEGGKVECFAEAEGTIELPALPSGHSRIVIRDCPDLDHADTEAGEFLLANRPHGELLWACPELEIYGGTSTAIFYRGIKALSLEIPSCFTYNILQEQKLTEDRTLPEFDAKWTLSRALPAISIQSVAEQIILGKFSWERTLDFTYGNSASPEFIKAVQVAVRSDHLNTSALRMTRLYYPTHFLPQPLVATPRQLKTIAAGTALLARWSLIPRWDSVEIAHMEEPYQFNSSILFLDPSTVEAEDFLVQMVQIWDNLAGRRDALAAAVVAMDEHLNEREQDNAELSKEDAD